MAPFPFLVHIVLPSFFLCLRGGVTGRPMFMPPYGYFAFFSAGFRIYAHQSVSDARSWHTCLIVPGRNTAGFRRRSSWPQRYRIPRSNSALKILSPSVVLRKTRIRLRPPVKWIDVHQEPPMVRDWYHT
jgi:hypothetical protein